MPTRVSTPQPPFRTWLEIDRASMRFNASAMRTHAGPGGRLMAVVKANGYGLGAVECARTLAAEVDAFGVATVNEAIELHESGVTAPIHVMSPVLPAERAAAVAFGVIAAVSTLDEARDLSRLAVKTQSTAAIHLVIDTGMGRIGVLDNEAVEIAVAVAALPGVVVESVGSHFPSAEDDPEFTRDQDARFRRLAGAIAGAGVRFPSLQIANSAGMLNVPRAGCPEGTTELFRCGLTLYGISPVPAFQPELRPVVSWQTRVVLVRTMPPGHGISYGRTFITPRACRVATLAVGYADGYQRKLSNTGADVLIRGHRCPLLGRVTMDQMMVDVSAVPDVFPGEEVVLIGRQGSAEISTGELAEKAGTIPYEILTGLGRRVARVPIG